MTDTDGANHAQARPKQPWFPFFPADWRADPQLNSCDAAARAVWLECLLLMHDGEPRGHLTLGGKPVDDQTLATLVRLPLKEVRRCLRVLRERGVYSMTDAGIIVSRRMVRDEEKARKKREAGAMGGNPVLKNQRLIQSQVNQQDNHHDNPRYQRPDTRDQNQNYHSSSLRSEPTLPLEGEVIKEKRVRKATEKKTAFPGNLILDANMIEFASKRGLDPEETFQRFSAWARSSGRRLADWRARFEKWCLDQPRFDQRSRNGSAPVRTVNVIEMAAKRLQGEGDR